MVEIREEVLMYEFITEGMSCGSCVKHVTHAVKSVDPKAEILVDLKLQKIAVKSAESEQQLVEVIEDAGYPILKSKKI